MMREMTRAHETTGRTGFRGLLWAFLLLHACTLSAQDGTAEKLALLGHQLGESFAQTVDLAAFHCVPAQSAFALRCDARRPHDLRIAQTGPDAVVLHFAEDSLLAVEVRFQEAAFAEVAGLLHATHGSSREQPERLRGGMGGYFENAIHLWEQDGAVLRLEQYAAGINTSSVILANATQMARLITPKKVDPVSGLKDL